MEEAKNTVPKKKNSANVRIFQSLALERKSNAAHFKASYKRFQFAGVIFKSRACRQERRIQLCVCCSLKYSVTHTHTRRRTCGISTHPLRGGSDEVNDGSSGSLVSPHTHTHKKACQVILCSNCYLGGGVTYCTVCRCKLQHSLNFFQPFNFKAAVHTDAVIVMLSHALVCRRTRWQLTQIPHPHTGAPCPT